MKALFAFLVLSVAALGQSAPNPSANVATNSGQFTFSASAMSLSSKGSTVAATDLGSTFAVTTNNSLRADGILGPNSQQGYLGGLMHFFSSKSILAKTNFDPATFQFYAVGEGGLVRAAGSQHAGFAAGGGVNYSPTHNGVFTVNLIEARIARLPGIANGVTGLYSGGLKFGW